MTFEKKIYEKIFHIFFFLFISYEKQISKFMILTYMLIAVVDAAPGMHYIKSLHYLKC